MTENNKTTVTIDKSKIEYRYSTASDFNAIREITLPYFGMLNDVVDVVEDRYFLAVYEGEIIAVSGINYFENYDGLEIDYTCTKPCYRNQGIMHEMFRRMLAKVSERVFCGCWKIGDAKRSNLQSFMEEFGFRMVIPGMSKYVHGYNCFAKSVNDCAYFKGDKSCYCCDDLWLRE